jgi:hypothetical protein
MRKSRFSETQIVAVLKEVEGDAFVVRAAPHADARGRKSPVPPSREAQDAEPVAVGAVESLSAASTTDRLRRSRLNGRGIPLSVVVNRSTTCSSASFRTAGSDDLRDPLIS